MKILAAFFSVVGPAFFWLMVVFLILEGFDRRPEKKGDNLFMVATLIASAALSMAVISYAENLNWWRSLLYLVFFPLTFLDAVF